MAWTDYLSEPSGSYALLLHIEGCPTVYTSRKCYAADGSRFPDPVDPITGDTYTVVPLLSAAGGIDPSSQKWEREKSVADGGDFAVEILANAAVRQMFATRLTGMAKTRLVDTADHDADHFDVADSTVLPATGGGWATVYRGRETVQYDTRDDINSRLGVSGDATHIRRGCYAWQSDSILTRRHTVHDGVARRELFVTDHPTTWRGRRVTLVRLQLDDDGRALPGFSTWQDGTEVRSGFIREADFSEWGRFRIVANDITFALKEYQIRALTKGSLAATSNDQGIYILGGGAQFAMRWSVWDGATNHDGSGTYVVTNDGTDLVAAGGTGVALTGYTTAMHMLNRMALRIATVINADTGADSVAVEIRQIQDINNPSLEWASLAELSIGAGSAASGGWVEVRINAYENLLGQYVGDIGDVRVSWDYEGGANGRAGSADLCHIGNGTTIPIEATEFPARVISDDGGVPTTPPTAGYVRITNGAVSEIVKYTGTSPLTNPPASYLLTGCTRGALGTVPRRWSDAIDDFGNPTDAPVTLEFLCGWTSTDFGTIALQTLLSTGTASAYSATYDVQPYGLALDPAIVDSATIVATLYDIRRAGILEEGITFDEFTKSIALLHGVQWFSETQADGRCRITCRRYGSPLSAQLALAHTYSTADGTILADPAPVLRHAAQRPIDRLVAKFKRFDPAGGDGETSEEITVVDGSREQDEGPGRTVEINAWGFDGDARAVAESAGVSLFNLYSPDEYDLTFATDATGQAEAVGDLVLVTISGIPNPEGRAGLTARPALVVAAEPHWFDDGDQPGAMLTVRLRSAVYGWAPSFKIATYTAGPPTTVTLADNEFSQAGDVNPMGLSPCKDWHFGPASGETYAVYIYEDGDWANRQACTATYLAAGQWTLSADVAAAGGFGAAPYYADFQAYGAAGSDSDQQSYAHIADTSYTLGAGGDDAHEWTA